MAYTLTRKAAEIPVPETGLGTVARNVAQLGSKVGETIAGAPGDITQGALGLANAGLSYVMPKSLPFKPLPEKIPFLPTSQDIHENVSKPIAKALGAPEDYLEPQGEYEKLANDAVSTLTSFMLPIPGLGGLKAGKAAALAGAGSLAKFGARKMEIGEGGQEAIKMGTMMAASMLGKSDLHKFMKTSYDTAESVLPEAKAVSAAKHIQPIVDDVAKKLDRGYMTGSKSEVNKIIQSIKNKTKDGMIPVQDVWEFKRNMNEILLENKDLKGLEKYIPKISKAMRDTLTDYGHGENKEFLEHFNRAEDIFQGLHKASPINKFLQRHVNADKVGYITAAMLIGGQPMGAAVKHIGQGYAAKGLVRATEALANSPEIRKYYLNIMSSAAKEHAADTLKNVKKLDSALSKQYPKDSIGSDRKVGTTGKFTLTRK